MNILSFEFIVLIGTVFFLSINAKGKARVIVLLCANVVYLLSFGDLIHIVWLMVMAVFTFVMSKMIEINRSKILLFSSIAVVVLSLCFFKYVPALGFDSLIMPLGMSFYSFKMISVLVDTYHNKLKSRNIFKFLTYISFFPTFTAGPITRAESFYVQLEKDVQFDYRRMKNGAVLCAMGMFEKMVFADALSIVCTQIFSFADAKGLLLMVGIVLYSFQIYLDFDAYSNIAIGISNVLGFEIHRNFHTPYLSSSIMEFWDRWHISLSTWLKEYIYIPLGGNRKGTVRKYVNILCVFIISGLWHGSTICFLIWGIGHGIVNIIQNMIKASFKEKKWSKSQRIIGKGCGILVNFVLVTFLWIFFRSATLQESFDIISRLFQFNQVSLDLTLVGCTVRESYWILFIVLVAIVLDVLRYHVNMIEWLANCPFVIRWSIYLAMITIAMIFGVYGPGYNAADFIYASF